MKTRVSIAIPLFVLVFLIPMAAALPQIINRDHSYLGIGLLASGVLIVVGIFMLLKKPVAKS